VKTPFYGGNLFLPLLLPWPSYHDMARYGKKLKKMKTQRNVESCGGKIPDDYIKSGADFESKMVKNQVSKKEKRIICT